MTVIVLCLIVFLVLLLIYYIQSKDKFEENNYAGAVDNAERPYIPMGSVDQNAGMQEPNTREHRRHTHRLPVLIDDHNIDRLDEIERKQDVFENNSSLIFT